VVTGQDHLQERYASAVAEEIRRRHDGRGPFDTVFFGGGTPGRLAPELIERILESARDSFGLAAGAEITVEANPASVDGRCFPALRRAGCNRLSLGVQSLADATLDALGRDHRASDGERALSQARDAGFDQVSVDLIFSVPGAPPGDWPATLGRVVELAPDHISAYALIIEAGTPLQERVQRGEMRPVDEDTDGAAYAAAQQVLGTAGYDQYEVSNFAQDGCRCRHNWDCWMGEEYVGVGLSAHSYLEGERSWNAVSLADYMESVEAGRSAVAGGECLDEAARQRELAWLRLRTSAGLRLTPEQRSLVGRDRRVVELVRRGLGALDDESLRLTGPGLAVADAAAEVICDALDYGRSAALTED